MLELLCALLFSFIVVPAAMLVSVVFWVWLLGVLAPASPQAWIDPDIAGPHCDINPRCHPAYVRASDGNGYVYGVPVE